MKKAFFAVALFFALAGLSFAAQETITHGTYVSKQDNKEYLTLSPNGTFVLKQRKLPRDPANPFVEITGKYSLSGETLILQLSDGGEASGKLKGNQFEDSGGGTWVKQGSETFDLQRPKRVRPLKELGR